MSNVNQLELTPSQLARLNQLHDIDLPQAISWWPLAWGWWALTAFCFMILAGYFFWRWVNKIKQYRVKYRALSRLAIIQKNTININEQVFSDIQLASDLSDLLKRTILAQFKCQKMQFEKQVLTLSGKQWADFLQHSGLSSSVAEFIAYAPYQTNYQLTQSKQCLINDVKHWIEKNT